jgi:hypothetical protein
VRSADPSQTPRHDCHAAPETSEGAILHRMGIETLKAGQTTPLGFCQTPTRYWCRRRHGYQEMQNRQTPAVAACRPYCVNRPRCALLALRLLSQRCGRRLIRRYGANEPSQNCAQSCDRRCCQTAIYWLRPPRSRHEHLRREAQADGEMGWQHCRRRPRHQDEIQGESLTKVPESDFGLHLCIPSMGSHNWSRQKKAWQQENAPGTSPRTTQQPAW